MGKKLVVVHDVLGTLFGFKGPIDELQRIFGDQLKDRMFAELIVMDWYHAAQRDFCFLSINGQYQPIANVFKAALPRVLLQAGLRPPTANSAEGAGGGEKNAGVALSIDGKTYSESTAMGESSPFGTETTQRMMASLQHLNPRPGMVEAFTKTYRDAELLGQSHVDRIDVWGATNGGIALAEKLFEGALRGGDEGQPIFTGAQATAKLASSSSPGRGVAVFSCDEKEVAKPDPRVYQEIRRRCVSDDEEDQASLWFVASHTWDLFAAKQAGFRTAWVTYEEFDMCKDIFGTHDVVASDLDTLAREIIKYEGRSN